MYQKVGFFLCFVLFSCVSIGQINMTVQLPPAGVILKSQLWNVVLVNTGNTSEDVHIALTLLNASDNQPVLSAETKVITVNKGVVQLKASDLNPIQYNYISSVVNADRNPNGLLPIGNYTACYTLYKDQYETVVQLAEDCEPLEVAPLSPPLLNTPEDEAVLQTANPLFTWLPPAPINAFSNLGYDLLVVEVLPGQDAWESIQENIPVYNIGNYKGLFNNYPASRKSLDTGKTYAWRIIARDNNQFVGQSDVWTFKISSNLAPAANANDAAYIKLRRGYESGFAVSKGSLKIEYNNEANDSVVTYSITNANNGVNVVNDGKLRLKYGQNLIEIPVEENIKLENNYMYLFKLYNSRSEEWNMKFSYIKSANSE